MIEKSLSNQEGLSLIRIGDGEGVTIAKPLLTESVLGDYIASHFGQISQQDLDRLATLTKQSCLNASIVGVRPDIIGGDFHERWLKLKPNDLINKVKEVFQLRPAEKERLGYEAALRLAILGLEMRKDLIPATTPLASAWCHYDMSASGFLARMIVSQKSVGIISRHTELHNLLSAHDIKTDFYEVPSRYNRRGEGWKQHYPARFNEILDSLRIRFNGQLFLVGAGICGKTYCNRIAELGGIGLDVGSVLDGWLGLNTRPLVMQSKFGADMLPKELTLAYQLERLTKLDEQ
ncbi:hypothetical protein [Cyanobium sp. CH-040]|uniref:hypothetical protein n=1 Tax=Cyanobium sp. CH-040 TaxID=2823708 RepID=UPI0020CB84BA|nr:hypothetical protein [Cyanobium sp. CH-040]MCP9926747.1 hypothetical protein [Cyanobium sp. CH-040]